MKNEDIIVVLEDLLAGAEQEAGTAKTKRWRRIHWHSVEALRAAIDKLSTHPEPQPNESQGDEWVSVKNRLPEWNTHCLVAYKNETTDCYKVCEIQYGDPWKNGFGLKGVTHWRPLPEPPEEERNE